MAQLGKRSRPPSMSRITSTAELGSLSNNPSVAGPDHVPAALGVQKEVVSAAAASSGRARKQRQAQAQAAHRLSTGSAAESGGLWWWPPAAFAAGKGLAHGVGGGTEGFPAVAALAALEPAQFLRACGLCNRRLGPGKDTYMYRGDMAFCSTDCRDLRIAHDERGSTCSLASVVPQATAAATTTAAAGSKATRTAA